MAHKVVPLDGFTPMQGIQQVPIAFKGVGKLISSRVTPEFKIAAGHQHIGCIGTARRDNETCASDIDRMPILAKHPKPRLIFMVADIKRTIKVNV